MSEQFDLSAYELDDFAICEINGKKGDGPLIGPDGEPVTIEVWGPGSAAAIAWENKQSRDITNRAMKAARGKHHDIDARRDFVAKLVAHTKAVNHFIPMTPEELYGNPKLGYISDQVARFMGDTANF